MAPTGVPQTLVRRYWFVT
uniref:Uncharacterized protein n=1 Tax=Anguilla anguilla TaxID=7936 RepID=A0A0E9UCV8_ANGAN